MYDWETVISTYGTDSFVGLLQVSGYIPESITDFDTAIAYIDEYTGSDFADFFSCAYGLYSNDIFYDGLSSAGYCAYTDQQIFNNFRIR